MEKQQRRSYNNSNRTQKEIKQEQPKQDVQVQPEKKEQSKQDIQTQPEKKEQPKQDVQQSASGFTNPIKISIKQLL